MVTVVRAGSIVTPAVSVVIPAFNRAGRIRATIDSALAQTVDDLELIIVDDASDDDTVAVAAAVDDRRVRVVVREHNGGPAAARNSGIELARGEFVAFLDSDDRWLPDKLQRQLAALRGAPAAVGACTTAFEIVDERGGIIDVITPARDGIGYDELLHSAWPGTPSTLLVRRDALERVGGFDESPELVSVEDWDLYLRLAGQAEFVCLPRVLTRYLSTADQLSGRLDVVITGHRAILERYRDDIEAGGPGLLAVHHFRLGSLLCLDGRVGEGRALLRRAAREDPARIKHWLGLAAAAGGQRNFRLLTTVNRLGHRGWRRLRHRRFATRDRGGTDR